jgi:hypothetical protein
VAAVERVGARIATVYGTAETYAIGLSCQRPSGADDMHVVSDLAALIVAGEAGAAAGFPPERSCSRPCDPRRRCC